MKTILILVISSQDHPYGKMIETSMQTWDSINVDGVQTVFYCGNPVKENTEKIIYFPLQETLHTMGQKTLLAFQWALDNKTFDYVARVNSSCYVNKKALIKYIQSLPDKNVFAGLGVAASTTRDKWIWGGGQFVISKDIIQLIVDNREKWDHSIMDDVAISFLMNALNVPYTPGKACSIDKLPNSWRCMGYGSETFEFTDFADIKKASDQFFFRVKQDHDRTQDEYIMRQLFTHLS